MHELLVAGSMSLACIQFISSIFLLRKNRMGWTLSITGNAIAIPYDIFTFQYGFVAVSIVTIVIAVKAWLVWKKEDVNEAVLENGQSDLSLHNM